MRGSTNVFVNQIIAGQAEGTSYEDNFAANPTVAMGRSQDLKAGAAAAVTDRLQQQSDTEAARQQSEEQAGLALNSERNRLQSIAALTAKNQTRANRQASLLAAVKAAAPVPASPQLVTPPSSPRTTSPMKSAASAAVAASNLAAVIQARADSMLAASAGGSQNVVSPLVQVGPTMGNQIVVSGSPFVVAPSPKGLIRSKSSLTDEDIANALNIPALSSKDESDYSSEISQIYNDLANISTSNLKKSLNKLLGALQYNSAVDKIKSQTGFSNLKEGIYKKMYLIASIDKLKGVLPPTASGKGIRSGKKRLIRGKCYTKHEHPTKKPQRHYIGQTFYIDLNKLGDNILCVKYSSNDSNLPRCNKLPRKRGNS